MDKFISEMDYNIEQKAILYNLKYSKHYLVDNENNENNENIINIIILGDIKNNIRQRYTILFNKIKGNFICNCKDFQFRAHKKNIVCKHISFIVCKVCKVLDHNYFKTKKMSDDNIKYITEYITNKESWTINKEFLINKYDKNDICGICCDTFNNTNVINCPECKNYVHKECIEIWLIRNKTCVYCRSNIFSNYEKIN